MATASGAQEAGITRNLAKFVHDLTYADLPEAVRELAKTRILDALSCAYAGRELPHSRIAIEIAKNNPGGFTVFGCSVKASLFDAIQANSVLVHSMGQADTAFAGHPSTMMIPAAFAVGEQEGASGEETLLAIVVGYEIMGRISKGVYPMAMAAFRPGPIMGTVGAGATAGKLLKLDVNRLTHALGYAASLAPGVPNEVWWAGTMESSFEAGVCARTGVLSAVFAKAGATSTPYVLEGRHGFLRCWAGTTERAHLITQELGKTFVMLETIIRAYPACTVNQLPMQAARPLAKLGLKAKDITRVVEKTWPGGTSYAGSDFAGPFANHFQALMSMQFCAAATILGRPVDDWHFFAEHYNDLEVGELARKVELVEEKGRTKPRLEVYCHDGRVLNAEEKTVDRGPLTPSREKMESKFMTLASASLGRDRAHQIIDQVMNLDRIQDIRQLTNKL